MSVFNKKSLFTWVKLYESWFLAVILLCIWAGFYVYDLGRSEFVHEEGRRALSAREMIQRDDFLIPSVLEKTYLNKPPGYPWLIMGLSLFTGGVGEWTVRLTSALGTAVTALAIFLFARDLLSIRARFLASAFFLVTLMSLEKGKLGEIEAVFTTLVWVALHFAWYGFRSSKNWRWWFLSGLGLGAAMLVKGPPALLFYYGTLLCFCVQSHRFRWFFSWEHAIVFCVSCLIFMGWLLPAIDNVGWVTLFQTGTQEMILRGQSGIAVFFDEHSSLIVNSFVGMLPGSFFLLAYFWRHRWENAGEHGELRSFLFSLVLSSFFFFLFFPGARARYLYPIAPAVAVLGAMVWERVDSHVALQRLSTVFTIILGGMGLLGFGTLYGLSALESNKMCLLVLLSLSTVFLLIGLRIVWRKRFAFSAILIQLALLCVLSETGVLARNGKQSLLLPARQSAMLLSTFISDERTLYTLSWSEFNLFYYVKERVVFLPSLNDLNRDGRAYYVAFSSLKDTRPFDRWEIVDYHTIPLAKNLCVWAVKIQ